MVTFSLATSIATASVAAAAFGGLLPTAFMADMIYLIGAAVASVAVAGAAALDG